MMENDGEHKNRQEDILNVLGNHALTEDGVHRLIFRKCEFKHFSILDKSQYKTESLSKLK